MFWAQPALHGNLVGGEPGLDEGGEDASDARAEDSPKGSGEL